MFRSAIYTGRVLHTRFRPKTHRLSYRVFSLLIDLDELEVLSKGLRLLGIDSWSLFSFHGDDHGKLEKGESLKSWALDHLERCGLHSQGMRVEVLVYPRILGYVFNPLTVYFCYSSEKQLVAILYEVCNTFHERHTYVIPVTAAAERVRHSCPKSLYVSPFMPMNCDYHFDIGPPGGSVAIRITETDPDGRMLFASFVGERRLLSDWNLMKVFFAYPLMTLKITAAIHFEALRLWTKGLKVFRHKAADTRTASTIVVAANGGSEQ
jgi:uncharacterized protein